MTTGKSLVALQQNEKKLEEMEFGFFEDLSETDQAYIREILACKTTACKEGKKPQFAWINDLTSVEAFDQLKGAIRLPDQGETEEEKPEQEPLQETKVLHETSNLRQDVPAQMVHVSAAMMPPGMVSQPAYTMGFGMPPAFINYAPGVPIYNMPHGAGMVPVFMPQVNYVPAVPVSLTGEQAPQMPVQQAAISVSNYQVVSGGVGAESTNTEDSFAADKTPQKSSERRNKKRRPADYYERLAKTHGNGSNESNDIDRGQYPGHGDMVESSRDHRLNSTNNSGDQERTHIEHVPAQDMGYVDTSVSSSIPRNRADHHHSDILGGEEARSQSSQISQHQNYTSPPPHCSQVEAETIQYHNTNSSVQFTSTTPTGADIINSQTLAADESKPEILVNKHSQPSSSGTNVSELESHKAPEGFPPLSESVPVQEVQTDKVVVAGANNLPVVSEHGTDVSSTKSDTESMQETSISETEKIAQFEGDNGDSVGTATLAEGQASATNEVITKPEPVTAAPPPKKPNSWAGLFSGTKEAQNATVIYTAKEKEKETKDEKVIEKKAEEKIPSVVSSTEDKLARDIGDALLNHKLNHKAYSLLPRGLKNRRNWCYISASLQALLACPPFYHLMKALPKREGDSALRSSTPVLDCLYRFVNEFSYLPHRSIDQNKALNAKGTMKMDIPQGQTFEPTYVYDVLKTTNYSSVFLDGRQEDAEEFFSSFINGLHEEMVACCKLLSPGAEQEPESAMNGVLGHESQQTGETEEEGWEQVGPKNKAVVTRTTSSPTSPISALFQGQIRSILHQTGLRESATLQPFFTLQLDIQSDKVCTVKDALDGLVRKESLQDYTCYKTKQEVEATRRMTLEELPPVLVLHLKYFLYDKSGGCQKLNKNIEYGVDLEISRELLSPNVKSKLSVSQRKYKLFGVVNHHGSRAVGGHYTTYVFHAGINGWIHIDDEIVRSVTVAQVLKHSPPKVPYLLYYRRMDHVQ